MTLESGLIERDLPTAEEEKAEDQPYQRIDYIEGEPDFEAIKL